MQQDPILHINWLETTFPYAEMLYFAFKQTTIRVAQGYFKYAVNTN